VMLRPVVGLRLKFDSCNSNRPFIFYL